MFIKKIKIQNFTFCAYKERIKSFSYINKKRQRQRKRKKSNEYTILVIRKNYQIKSKNDDITERRRKNMKYSFFSFIKLFSFVSLLFQFWI